MNRSSRLMALGGLGALTLLIGCLDSIVRELGPENDPQVTNTAASFEFKAEDLENVNDELTFNWVNSAPQAAFRHNSFIHHGYGIVIITDGAGVQDALETMLRQVGPIPDDRIPEVQSLVEWIAHDPSLTSVEGLSAASGLSIRAIQRMFRYYVGVSPKWMIRRCRLQEAAARVEAGGVENWAALAQQLGYFDQAHFIREFRQMVGQPPAEYLKRVRAPGGALT